MTTPITKVTASINASIKVLPPVENAKRLAAYAAVDRHISPNDKLIGIGCVRADSVGDVLS